MACKHVDAAGNRPCGGARRLDTNFLELRPPTAAQSVYREDCTQCFDSIVWPQRHNSVFQPCLTRSG